MFASRMQRGGNVRRHQLEEPSQILAERVAARIASSSTATLFAGANVSPTRHARIRREKLSITACR